MASILNGGNTSPISHLNMNGLNSPLISAQMKILVNLNEKDIIKLIVEFLANRELNISMLDLERETGVINGAYSDDILFLRQLILDGQWDDAIEFIQPLKQIDSFNSNQFHFLIMKYQYLELLCLKSEANVNEINQMSVDQLVAYLTDLRPYCPTEDEYKKLCLLLTSSRLQDHNEFKTWNPSSGRLQCFKEIFPLVNKFLSVGDTSVNNKFISQNERLVQLIVKGLLYESCVEYCQARATQSTESYNLSDPNVLLMQMQLSETDASLLSWLHALPFDTFSCPFEEKPLKLNMNKFIKPSLEATWADAILATPIKPQKLFPYNAVPTGRSRNTELMSRSLAPQYDGLSFGLNRSQIFTSEIEMQLNNNTNSSNNQHSLNNNNNNNNNSNSNSNSSSNNQTNGMHTNKKSQYQRDLNDLTRSIALFNLEMPSTNVTASPVPPNPIPSDSINRQPNKSLTTSYLSKLQQQHQSTLNEIIEEDPAHLVNETNSDDEEEEDQKENNLNNRESSSNMHYQSNPMSDSTLFKEYQKNKAQIMHQLEEQEKKREEYVKQLKVAPNVYNALNAVSKSTALKNSNGNGNSKNVNSFDEPSDESFLSPKFQRRNNENNNYDLNSAISNDTAVSQLSNSNSTSPPMKNQTNSGSDSGSAINVSPTTRSTSSSSSNINQSKPNYKQQQQSESSSKVSQNNIKPPSKIINSQQRLINDATKFDSLDDITRAASFLPICSIEDQQAIRAVDIHPSGNFYVVGSNSKCLRVCPYPSLDDIKTDHVCKPASVLFKKSKHHYGSIYCTAWNTTGNLIATGSNDKTIKLIKFSPDFVEDIDSEIELTHHNGTVRDLIFMQQEDNNILISGGAGDCKIHVLDTQTQQSLRVYSGHNGHIYTLFTWSGTKNVFVSGSQDKTCRFWDLRTPEAIQVVAPSTSLALQGSPVASVAVDPSGLLLSSGHEDAACCLYDIRGSRIVQIYKPHSSDIRSVRFSANAYYLLTASYDNKVIITDLHGDLTKPLNWSIVASHNDKIIQAKWHPNQMSFITTSADRTSTVWSLPTTALVNASVI